MWASHPLADSQGRVLHHRFVASLKIGRWVTSDEHVHHIDGNKLNNTPDNLEVLSSREHAKLHFPGPAPKLCLVCGKSFVPTKPSSKYCSRSCFMAVQKKADLSKEELSELLWAMPVRDIGARLGVSDVAIHKLCKKMKVKKPPRGYWLRKKVLKGLKLFA
jgi:hypothetical protein